MILVLQGLSVGRSLRTGGRGEQYSAQADGLGGGAEFSRAGHVKQAVRSTRGVKDKVGRPSRVTKPGRKGDS